VFIMLLLGTENFRASYICRDQRISGSQVDAGIKYVRCHSLLLEPEIYGDTSSSSEQRFRVKYVVDRTRIQKFYMLLLEPKKYRDIISCWVPRCTFSQVVPLTRKVR